MSRPTEVILNLAAIRHNLYRSKIVAPNTLVYAIVKADGYGHGILPVANALEQADGLGVASIDEALILIKSGIRKPIVLLEGFFESCELVDILHHQLETVVHNHWQLNELSQYSRANNSPALQSQKIDIWLKIDTGMNRLGFTPEEFPEVWQKLNDLPFVKTVKLMTHLANADDSDDDFTNRQIKLFSLICKNISARRSIANSAGILAWPGSHGDIIRPGVMLYGASPLINSSAKQLDLLPAMTLQTKLIAVKTVSKNSPIGYGGDWVAPTSMRIGVAAIGYGDGYPRHARSGTPVAIANKRAKIVGRVSMDMVCVDLSQHATAKIGDSVQLWGDQVPAEEVARYAMTIPYELFCGVTQRVRRVEA